MTVSVPDERMFLHKDLAVNIDRSGMIDYNEARKGVPVKDLRGGCIPSTSPDLGNANVGMRR